MKINKTYILLISTLISIVYYSLINELSKTTLIVMTVVFIILQILYSYLLFKNLKSKKSVIGYIIVLLVSLLVVVGGRIYLYENNYIVNESYNLWNNIYVEYEGTTYSKEVGFYEREKREYIAYSWEKEFQDEYQIQDYIRKGEFTYYVVMIPSNYVILKVDSEENVVQRIYLDKNSDSKKIVMMESQTDAIYFYEVYCSSKGGDSIIQDCNYKVFSFDSDLNIIKDIEIKEKNLVALSINNEYIYALSDKENMLIKYDLNGNIVNNREYRKSLEFSEPDSYNIFVDNNYIYIYQLSHIYDVRNEEYKIHDQLTMYDLDFNYHHTILFEALDNYYRSSMSRAKKAPGENFKVDYNENNYIIGTKFFGIELSDTKESFYVNIITLETIHSKDIAKEFNMHTALVFTMTLLVMLPMYLICGIVFIICKLLQNKR